MIGLELTAKRFVSSWETWKEAPSSHGLQEWIEILVQLQQMAGLEVLSQATVRELGEIFGALVRADPRGTFRIEDLSRALGVKAELKSSDELDERSIEVDPETGEISLRGHGLISLPVAKLIKTLGLSRSLSFEQAAFICFGIHRYDPVIHNPKVFSLLSRARKVFSPTLHLKTRSGIIFSEGNWERIRVLEKPLWTKCLVESQKWNDFILIRSQIRRKKLARVNASDLYRALESLRGAEFSRRDVEAVLQISKTNSLRVIQRWLEEARIERVSKGKHVRYLARARTSKDLGST